MKYPSAEQRVHVLHVARMVNAGVPESLEIVSEVRRRINKVEIVSIEEKNVDSAFIPVGVHLLRDVNSDNQVGCFNCFLLHIAD